VTRVEPEDGASLGSARRWTALLVVLIVIGTSLGTILPAGLGWDFANFYDAGRRAAAGRFVDLYDPASPIAGEAPQGALRFYGTPLSALFYAPLSHFSPLAASRILKVQNTLAYLASFLLLYVHFARLAGSSPATRWKFAALFAFLVLLYQPFWSVYRLGGQTTPTVFLLLSMALISHTEGREVVTAALLVLAVLIKPAFIILLGFLVLVSGARFLAATAACLALASAASFALLGSDVHGKFFSLVLQGTTLRKPWLYNSSLFVPLHDLALSAGVAPAAFGRAEIAAAILAVKGLVLVTFVTLMLQSRHRPWAPQARRHFGFLMAVLFFLLTSEVVWEHYLSVLFLPIGYVWAVRRHFRRSAIWMMVAIAVLALGQSMVVVELVRSCLTGGYVVLASLAKSAPLWLMLAFLWRHSAELMESYEAPPWARPAS
jgi:Glycosyltransferase family 87